MPDLLTDLTSLAVSVFRAQSHEDYRDPLSDWLGTQLASDPVLYESRNASLVLPNRHDGFAPLVERCFEDGDLTSLQTQDGVLDPMLLHPGGGTRTSPAQLMAGILSSAFTQIYFFRLPRDENTFVRTVLEGFEELRRAVRGEQVRAYMIRGLGGVTLEQGHQINTPWGVIRAAPPAQSGMAFGYPFRPATTCVLAQPLLTPVRFDRAAQPKKADFAAGNYPNEQSAALLPVACALASSDLNQPAVPLVTWSMMLLPFQAGPGHSMPILPPRIAPQVEITDLIEGIEQWARIVNEAHADAVDLGARRLVSATSVRMDRADSLIDAIMGWENLVGTSDEVTYRVTAALAKLLEPEISMRRQLRKSLAKVYSVRSRLVHGATVPAKDINAAATEAVSVLIQALRAGYTRGRTWMTLKSSERADRLLLEEP